MRFTKSFPVGWKDLVGETVRGVWGVMEKLGDGASRDGEPDRSISECSSNTTTGEGGPFSLIGAVGRGGTGSEEESNIALAFGAETTRRRNRAAADRLGVVLPLGLSEGPAFARPEGVVGFVVCLEVAGRDRRGVLGEDVESFGD